MPQIMNHENYQSGILTSGNRVAGISKNPLKLNGYTIYEVDSESLVYYFYQEFDHVDEALRVVNARYSGWTWSDLGGCGGCGGQEECPLGHAVCEKDGHLSHR
ncbi:MAG: hypothetical protein CL678_07680 [Bdellovibrionaceae bacterium]|nr:hypothetical protein [Pseudobdellovibrionaceae bacterium]|tara:strand:+ start:652 stop:960 length:309 start_codon:yes stop_codon:yes gene_type:complete